MTLMTQCAQADQEGRQHEEGTRILPIQPRRTLRTNEPPPRAHVKEKRGGAIVRTTGALSHGGYLLPVLRLTVLQRSDGVNRTKG
jgi:hypothetical protein